MRMCSGVSIEVAKAHVRRMVISPSVSSWRCRPNGRTSFPRAGFLRYAGASRDHLPVPAPLAAQDLDTMRAAVFFEGPEAGRKLSRFWILLLLAAVIASAGVVGDSTATVIGAMIVAPLMTPIQGTMLAVVTGARNNLARSLGLVVAGAAAAIGIGFVVGLLVVTDVVAATNSQVAGRVSPRLIDLLAALATGVVGSV